VKETFLGVWAKMLLDANEERTVRY